MTTLDVLARRLGKDSAGWSAALTEVLGRPIEVRHVEELGRQGAKAHGMTRSLALDVIEPGGAASRWFVKQPDEALYAEQLPGDRAREIAWRLHGYPAYRGHATCVAIGEVDGAGSVRAGAVPSGNCFVVEQGMPGELYAERLARLGDKPSADDGVADARLICAHMASLHRRVANAPAGLYARALRETLINAALRVTDASTACGTPNDELLAGAEHGLLDWRRRLRNRGDRLRVTHNDFHPWNILIDGDRVRLLGARSPGVGDPANDVAGALVNYVWFSYQTLGDFGGAYRRAFEAFWERYLELTGDHDCRALLAPFFALRILVLLNPAYYPSQEPWVSAQLERLLTGVLAGEIDIVGNPEALRPLRAPAR